MQVNGEMYLSLFHINNITTPSIKANPGIFTISMLKQQKAICNLNKMYSIY
jgi:hypothetical protein